MIKHRKLGKMNYSEIMVRHGELSTKGKNRMRFINKLKKNIQDVLAPFSAITVRSDRDRTHVYLNGTDYQPIIEALKLVLGFKLYLQFIRLTKVFLSW